jgi:hypothetical protein
MYKTTFLETSALLAAASVRESMGTDVSDNPINSTDCGISPSTSALRDCVALLERSQQNLVHLGRLADIQTLRHGLPTPIPTPSLHCGTSSKVSREVSSSNLDPRNELLHTFALALTAYHMAPPGTLPFSELFLPTASSSPIVPAPHSSRVYSGSGQSKSVQVSDEVQESSQGSSFKKSKKIQQTRDEDQFETLSNDVPPLKADEKGDDKQSLRLVARSNRATNETSIMEEDTMSLMDPLSSLVSVSVPSLVEPGQAKSRSKWSPAEITLFEEGIRLYGEHNPKQISEHMRGCRNNEQVRERIKSIKRSLGLQKKYVPPTSQKR